MRKHLRPSGLHWFIFQIAVIGLWAAQLLYTDAYYVNYLLLLIAAVVCCTYNFRMNVSVSSYPNRNSLTEIVFSAVFTLMVTLANYNTWVTPAVLYADRVLFLNCYKLFVILCFLGGGFICFWNIFIAITTYTTALIWNPDARSVINSKNVFWLCLFLIILSRSIVLFFCCYPGILTPDSISQITQILTGNYSNHHPYYYSQVIRIFLVLGLRLFGEINAAVATYSFFQILLTAFCFSLAVSTMARMGVPKQMLIAAIAFYMLMPYHILYGITMWKDIPFGCFTLLFIIFMYNCMQDVGNPLLNHGALAITGLGICLFRSNGFFVFTLLTVCFLVLWRFKYRKILFLFLLVLISGYILKHPVLNRLNVPQPDLIESLSVPAQQIALVIRDGLPLTDWETSMLEKAVDLEQVPAVYRPFTSDPIKGLVRATGNQQILTSEKMDYIKLYLMLGCRYPSAYLRAWIDLTRGYWNAGYEYWIWTSTVHENALGIIHTVRNEPLYKIMSEYLWLFTNIQGLRLFLSIGLSVWLNGVLTFIALIRKDKLGVFLTLPVLAVVASLLVATPVFSEFRYIYSVFCVLPVLTVFILRPRTG